MSDYPTRIVCLTEETCETLYLLGGQDRIVGISGFTERPARARKEKPMVSGFSTAQLDRILDLKPDLVLGFSDIQSEIAAKLIAKGIAVHVFNQRTIAETLQSIRVLGGIIGCGSEAETLADNLREHIEMIGSKTAQWTDPPRVYFEEWPDPLITGIAWVSELIEIAGGRDAFSEHAHRPLAKDRIIEDPAEVIARAPDIILASWCGKPFVREQLESRDGWQDIPAVRNGDVYEIPSSCILAPGPAALTEGMDRIHTIIAQWRTARLKH